MIPRLELEERHPDWMQFMQEQRENESHKLYPYYLSFVRYPLCWLEQGVGPWIEMDTLLTLSTLEERLSRGISCAVSFGRETDYCVIDIDHKSRYHPRNAGWGMIELLIETLAKSGIGTCAILQSSASEGIHIFANLGRTVKSDNAALVLAAAAHMNNLIIQPGQLEIFPSVRSSEIGDYNQIRLPLTGAGSKIIAASWGHLPADTDLDSFTTEWIHASLSLDTQKTDWIETLDAPRVMRPETETIRSLIARGLWK